MTASPGAVVRPSNPVVLAVGRHRQPDVLLKAARVARLAHSELILAHIDDTRYTMEVGSEGRLLSVPARQDAAPHDTDREKPTTAHAGDAAHGIAELIRNQSSVAPVRWSYRRLAGEPAQALIRLADEVDALLIAIASSLVRLGTTVEDRCDASLGVHVIHLSACPVMIIPSSAVPEPAPITESL